MIKRRLIKLLVRVTVAVILISMLPRHRDMVRLYDQYIFYPFQSFRIIVFQHIPFSAGDVIYVLWGVGLLVAVIRWIYYIARFQSYKYQLAASVLDVVNAAAFIYLFFLLGWGANYYKPALAESWELYRTIGDDPAERRKSDSTLLVAFDQFLVKQLNAYAPHYHYATFADINSRAKKYYLEYTDSKVRADGLDIKPSLFAYFMERMAVDGYYNPFTGEGQTDDSLPSFELPFTVCHEMAHQAGIAAEGDANLMAYAVGTIADDSSFRYSAYLNIWLYTHHRLYRRDSVLAGKLEHELNALTTAHLDTLDQLSRRYNTDLTHYSAEIYDDYLKMQRQKDGLRSYGNVVSSAWLLEQKRSSGLIHVP